MRDSVARKPPISIFYLPWTEISACNYLHSLCSLWEGSCENHQVGGCQGDRSCSLTRSFQENQQRPCGRNRPTDHLPEKKGRRSSAYLENEAVPKGSSCFPRKTHFFTICLLPAPQSHLPSSSSPHRNLHSDQAPRTLCIWCSASWKGSFHSPAPSEFLLILQSFV